MPFAAYGLGMGVTRSSGPQHQWVDASDKSKTALEGVGLRTDGWDPKTEPPIFAHFTSTPCLNLMRDYFFFVYGKKYQDTLDPNDRNVPPLGSPLVEQKEYLRELNKRFGPNIDFSRAPAFRWRLGPLAPENHCSSDLRAGMELVYGLTFWYVEEYCRKATSSLRDRYNLEIDYPGILAASATFVDWLKSELSPDHWKHSTMVCMLGLQAKEEDGKEGNSGK